MRRAHLALCGLELQQHLLVGMRLRDIRALATLSKHWKTIVDGQEVWRLCCAMLAREHNLCAPF